MEAALFGQGALDYGLDVEVAETGLVGALGSGTEHAHSREARVKRMMEGLRERSQVGLFWEAGGYRTAYVGGR